MSREPEKVIMGSCQVAKGEGEDYIKGAVERASKQNPEYYFFDIVARKQDGSAAAARLLAFFYSCVSDFMPNFPLDKVFAGITFNEEIRPATMALVVLSNGADYAFKDINPGREKRWPK